MTLKAHSSLEWFVLHCRLFVRVSVRSFGFWSLCFFFFAGGEKNTKVEAVMSGLQIGEGVPLSFSEAKREMVKLACQAHIVGPLCVHQSIERCFGYDISHVKTGFSMRPVYKFTHEDGFEFFDDAVRVARALCGALTDAEWSELDPDNKEVVRAHSKKLFPAARQALSEITN